MQSLTKNLLFAITLLSISIASFQIGMAQGETHWKEIGKQDALSINPVSEELEMVCAGLWFGENLRQYHERKSKK